MDLDNIKDVYNLNDNDIDYIQTNYKLEKISKRIYNQDFNKYNQDFEEYYNNQSDKKDKYYLIDNDNNKIICFDYSCSEYFCEEFNLKDYNYAYQWLNNEIEYEDYLNRYKDEMDI
jgi:hypothetical protein